MPSHFLNQCWNIVNWTLRNLSEILIEIHIFSFRKMHLKMSSGKWRPFYLSLNVFIMYKKISYQNVSRATADAHYSPNWWTALYKSSSRSPPNALLNKTCVSDVASKWDLRYELHAVTATKERKSINWNLSQNKNTTFQGIPTVNIRQPGDCLIENRALAFRK